MIASQCFAKDILKTKNIIRFNQDQTVSQILSSLKNSHDAGFVFDKKTNFWE